jgi:hypothetical protein
MNDIQKRFLLFLFGCILVRSLLVYISKEYTQFLPLLGYGALLISIGFFTIFFTGSRKTGRETFGAKIWWNNLRPVHGLLYLLFAVFAIQRKSYAWIFLLIDVIIGLSSFLVFHYREGNFSKLKN